VSTRRAALRYVRDYAVEEVLGQGAFGTVLQVKRGGGVYAMKELPLASLAGGVDGAGNNDTVHDLNDTLDRSVLDDGVHSGSGDEAGGGGGGGGDAESEASETGGGGAGKKQQARPSHGSRGKRGAGSDAGPEAGSDNTGSDAGSDAGSNTGTDADTDADTDTEADADATAAGHGNGNGNGHGNAGGGGGNSSVLSSVSDVSSVTSQLTTEVDILRSLSHPNIVKYYSSFVEDGNLYIVMEKVDGSSLSDRLASVAEKGEIMPEAQLWAIFSQICMALRYIHKEKRVVHRDLSPANILIDGADTVKIADFGLARQRRSEQSVLESWVGTISYACPEIITHEAYGEVR
jgi:serine/threonine protein kinase